MTTSARTHARILDLATAAPVFPLAAAEDRELRAHLRACPDCAARVARLRTDLAAIGRVDPVVSSSLHDRIREVAVTPPRSGPSVLGIVVVALLAIGVVGASVGAGAFLAQRPAPPASVVAVRAGDTVRWHTDVVDLAAAGLAIDANGLTFRGVSTPTVHSDPGSLTYWTLETEWQEHGREQRLFLYFGADANNWWIDEIRTYDGSGGREANWATFARGPWARTPLGGVFEGDLDLAGSSATGPVRLRLTDLRIAVRPDDHITVPIGGGKVLKENGNPAVDGDPFQAGGPLRCSGILQLPPAAAERRLLALGYRLSWRWEYATGGNTGYAAVRETAPGMGWITGTAIGSSGELIVFVADPARPFGGSKRDLPADCTAPVP